MAMKRGGKVKKGKKKQVGMMMKRGGKLELKGGGKVMKGKKKKVMKKKKGKKRG